MLDGRRKLNYSTQETPTPPFPYPAPSQLSWLATASAVSCLLELRRSSFTGQTSILPAEARLLSICSKTSKFQPPSTLVAFRSSGLISARLSYKSRTDPELSEPMFNLCKVNTHRAPSTQAFGLKEQREAGLWRAAAECVRTALPEDPAWNWRSMCK